MVPTDRGVIRVAEADDKLLIFDISDDALERAAPIIGGASQLWSRLRFMQSSRCWRSASELVHSKLSPQGCYRHSVSCSPFL